MSTPDPWHFELHKFTPHTSPISSCLSIALKFRILYHNQNDNTLTITTTPISFTINICYFRLEVKRKTFISCLATLEAQLTHHPFLGKCSAIHDSFTRQRQRLCTCSTGSLERHILPPARSPSLKLVVSYCSDLRLSESRTRAWCTYQTRSNTITSSLYQAWTPWC